MTNESLTLYKGYIIIIILFLLMVLGVLYMLGWIHFLSDQYGDEKCRTCALEHNLTCIEQPSNKNFYTEINNIDDTDLNCDNEPYVYRDCRSCLNVFES